MHVQNMQIGLKKGKQNKTFRSIFTDSTQNRNTKQIPIIKDE